jgi:hypothetical protein
MAIVAGLHQIAPRPEAYARQRDGLDGSSASDETLVLDARHDVCPAQMVENKLLRLLRNSYRPMSHTLTRGLSNGRNHR